MRKKSEVVIHKVESSDIIGVGYDKTTQTLGILFKKNRMIYHYPAPPKDYADLMAAPSKGKWVYDHLRTTKRPFVAIDPMKEIRDDVVTAMKVSLAQRNRSLKDGEVLPDMPKLSSKNRAGETRTKSGRG